MKPTRGVFTKNSLDIGELTLVPLGLPSLIEKDSVSKPPPTHLKTDIEFTHEGKTFITYIARKEEIAPTETSGATHQKKAETFVVPYFSVAKAADSSAANCRLCTITVKITMSSSRNQSLTLELPALRNTVALKKGDTLLMTTVPLPVGEGQRGNDGDGDQRGRGGRGRARGGCGGEGEGAVYLFSAPGRQTQSGCRQRERRPAPNGSQKAQHPNGDAEIHDARQEGIRAVALT